MKRRPPELDKKILPVSRPMKSVYWMNRNDDPLRDVFYTPLEESQASHRSSSSDVVMFSLEKAINPAIAEVPCS